jgi:glycosyltransferase involved in cell wall biosynthesis
MNNNTKQKLLFIMPSMVAGGAERVLINLLSLIDKDRYDIDLVVIERKGKLWDEVPKHVNKKLLFPNAFISKIGAYLLRTYRNDIMFRFFSRSIKGNYIAAFSFLDSVYSEFLFYNSANIERRIAVIHSSYKTYSNKSKFIKGGYKQMMIERYSKMDTIVTVSHESLEQFKELFGVFRDMRVLYNPINNRDIINNSVKNFPVELLETTFNFIAVGSLLPVKGYDLLIEACSILKDKIEDFKVFILGEGYLKEDLQKQIDKHDLNNHVKLQGFESNPYSWMKQADALLMTSKAEGLPTVLCESLILGTPSIVPNVPGCREVIDYGKYGLMYERTADALADKMESLIRNKELHTFYKEKAKERAQIFDDKKVLAEYYEIFQNPVSH